VVAVTHSLHNRTNIGAQAYTYDGLGDRVRVDKARGTRHFVYDAWGRVIAEYGASALDVKAEFIWAVPPAANDNSPFGGGDHIGGYAPLALVAENGSNSLELYWVHGNHLGVPLVTTNAAGQVVTPGNDFLRPGFPGQSEVLADLYYNRARDYDPVTGRYIQADPIGLGGDVNPYVYAGADPVNGIDPDGLVWKEVGGALLVGGANLGYQLYNNGGRWECVDWWEVADWALMGSGLGFARSWFVGMVRKPTGNYTSWVFNTVSKRLRKHNGLVGKEVDLHHWLVTQNIMNGMKRHLGKSGRKLVDRTFNQPWNLNPVNRTFHQQTLNRAGYAQRLIRGAPRPVQGIGVTTLVAGGVNAAEVLAND
jgi:RHS repeat-associated protein